jgi:hypothetical protein
MVVPLTLVGASSAEPEVGTRQQPAVGAKSPEPEVGRRQQPVAGPLVAQATPGARRSSEVAEPRALPVA